MLFMKTYQQSRAAFSNKKGCPPTQCGAANKATHLLLFLFLLPFMSFSQDVIVMKNGEEVNSKVVEVTQVEVKYRKFENLEGPIYTLPKSDILFIRYQNGTKEIISVSKSISSQITGDEGQDPASRLLIVQKQTTGKKYIFRELNNIWLKFRGNDNQIQTLSGVLVDIRESSILVNKEAIPLSAIVTVKVQRSGREVLTGLGLGAALGALITQAQYGPNSISTSSALLSIPLTIGGLCIREKLPIGSKFVVLTQLQ
jgi:hypothetical protein